MPCLFAPSGSSGCSWRWLERAEEVSHKPRQDLWLGEFWLIYSTPCPSWSITWCTKIAIWIIQHFSCRLQVLGVVWVVIWLIFLVILLFVGSHIVQISSIATFSMWSKSKHFSSMGKLSPWAFKGSTRLIARHGQCKEELHMTVWNGIFFKY